MARGTGAGATGQVRTRCTTIADGHEESRFVGGEKRHFGHPVEREFAAMLDAYGIVWEYEPHLFLLRALDPEGVEVACERSLLVNGELPDGYRLVEAFRPDFYLPESNRYVETTVMLSRNITRKRKKIRHLHELYPELKISLFARRDFERLAATRPGAFAHVPEHGVADAPR